MNEGVPGGAFAADEYYSRQIVLPELRREGQEKLRRSSAAVIGLGGMGTVSTLYLALAGVGKLRLVDQDTVELNNLHRQVLYGVEDLRMPKVEAAARRIEEINPEVRVEPVPENLRGSNVDKLVSGVDCVVDGLDNMHTRYIVNRGCIRNKVPYVFGGAIGLEGNLSVFRPPATPCLECILPNLKDEDLPTCDVRGVLGATTGIIGSLEAIEAVKLLAGIDKPLTGKLLLCDLREMDFRTVEISKRPGCEACQVEQLPLAEVTERLAWLCGRDTINVNPAAPVEINLERAYGLLSEKYNVYLRTPLVVVFSYEGYEVSLFKGGRMLIKNVKSEDEALRIYRELVTRLGEAIGPD